MTLDRAELAGTGIALAFHVALVAALSLHLAKVDTPPEPPSMEVELVDEVGLAASAPTPITVPPPPSQAPDVTPAVPALAPPIESPPMIEPAAPQPRIAPTPAPRPAPAARPTPPTKRVEARPAPARPAPAKAAPARPAPRATRIGDDFLKGIGPDRPARAAASAATFSAAAKADVASAIAAQIRPCALRQRALGDGANRIRIVLNIRLTPAGRLKGAPTVVRTSGIDEDNAQFEELVKDQAIASYRQCAPLRLPVDLYQTAQGGWSNINMTYRLP